jgi:hypothetical protein
MRTFPLRERNSPLNPTQLPGQKILLPIRHRQRPLPSGRSTRSQSNPCQIHHTWTANRAQSPINNGTIDRKYAVIGRLASAIMHVTTDVYRWFYLIDAISQPKLSNVASRLGIKVQDAAMSTHRPCLGSLSAFAHLVPIASAVALISSCPMSCRKRSRLSVYPGRSRIVLNTPLLARPRT